MTSQARLELIMLMVKDNSLIIIEGKLGAEEEAKLISKTMEFIGKDEDFNGIELGVFHDYAENHAASSWLKKIHLRLAKLVAGDSKGLTIIGPANIIKELRQEPRGMELHFQKGFIKNASQMRKV